MSMSSRAQRAVRRAGKKERAANAGAATATAAAAAPPAPAPSFNGLPDELALRIFSCLDLRTRVGVAALVCTRWRQLAQSPQLMRSVEVCLRGCPAVPLSAAFSFGEWYYEWAGPHAQRLHVELPVDFGPYEADDEEIVYALDRLDNMLYTSVDDYGCHLQELRLMQQMPTDIDWEVAEDCWGLTSLRRLHIHMPKGCFGFNCEPDSLPLLTDLELVGFMDLGQEPKPLPPSLTHLCISLRADFWQEDPPEQMSNLPNLRSLVLHKCSWESLSYYDLLERFTHLERLGLIECREMPTGLDSLTGLKLLHLSSTPLHAAEHDAEQLAASLPDLTQLTGLIINHTERLWQRANLSSAISGLPLQHLSMLGSDPAHGEPPLVLPPPGSWQGQLRELVLPAATAAAALPQLAAATRLEALTLLHLCSIPAAQQEALLAVAAQHPSLRRLRLDASGPHLCPATFAAVSAALCENRALRLLPGLSSGDSKQLAEEAWEACCCGGEFEPWALPAAA